MNNKMGRIERLKRQEYVRKALKAAEHLHHKQKEEVMALLDEERRELAYEDFYTFLVLFAPKMMPNEYIDGAHIHIYCEKLQEVEEAVSKGIKEHTEKYWKKVMFCLPPGAMKSVTLNLFIAWCAGRHPSWRFLQISHSLRLAIDNCALPIKDLIKNEEFAEIFDGCVIDDKGDTQDSFRFTQGGAYFCGGSGTKISGRRYHVAVVDDALSEQDADSVTERTKINNWYIPGLRSRRQKMASASEIIANTRWHKDDLCGFLIEKDRHSTFGGWEIIKFPAILTRDQAEEFAKYIPEDKELYYEGGSFWPQLHDLGELEDLKKGNTEAKWMALYMQSPITEGGSIFNKKWFRPYVSATPPECDSVFISVDTAFSEKERADFTAFTVWGIYTDFVESKDEYGREYEKEVRKMILLHNEKGRWAFHDIFAKYEELEERFNPVTTIVEKAASGHVMVQEMARYNKSFEEFIPGPRGGDKGVRANQVAPYVRNGAVWIHVINDEVEDLAKGVYNNEEQIREFLEEVSTFVPKSATYDDYVDSMVMAIYYAVDVGLLRTANQTDLDEEDQPYRTKRKTYF